MKRSVRSCGEITGSFS